MKGLVEMDRNAEWERTRNQLGAAQNANAPAATIGPAPLLKRLYLAVEMLGGLECEMDLIRDRLFGGRGSACRNENGAERPRPTAETLIDDAATRIACLLGEAKNITEWLGE